MLLRHYIDVRKFIERRYKRVYRFYEYMFCQGGKNAYRTGILVIFIFLFAQDFVMEIFHFVFPSKRLKRIIWTP